MLKMHILGHRRSYSPSTCSVSNDYELSTLETQVNKTLPFGRHNQATGWKVTSKTAYKTPAPQMSQQHPKASTASHSTPIS